MAVKAYFQVDGEVTTYDVDGNLLQLTIGAVNRDYSAIDLFNDGGIMVGQGSISPRTLSFSRQHRILATDATGTAINSERDSWNRLMTLPESKTLYFYLLNTDETRTIRAEVRPMSAGDEIYNNYLLSNPIGYNFVIIKGLFENVAETEYTKTLTTTGLETLDIDNEGLGRVWPVISFTPSQAFTLFQVQLSDGYGFKLETSFASGQEIIFNCDTGVVTVAGNELTNIQTAGSQLYLDPGEDTLSIYACPGDFSITWHERYV